MKKLLLLSMLTAAISVAFAQTKITFDAEDGLPVTADLYMNNDTLPYMILCHQEEASRGEYTEIAKKFGKLGYNCIAIDARAGKAMNEIENETYKAAVKRNKKTDYLEAIKDINAAIDYAYGKNNKKVVLVGSSYSASLALKIAVDNEKVKAVFAFSPGEYFENKLKVKEAVKALDKPVFVSSSKDEAQFVTEIFDAISSSTKKQFIPEQQGMHGAKSLWKDNPNYNEYWLNVVMFSKKLR
jgi:dienelactone hydrolase